MNNAPIYAFLRRTAIAHIWLGHAQAMKAKGATLEEAHKSFLEMYGIGECDLSYKAAEHHYYRILEDYRQWKRDEAKQVQEGDV